MENILEKINNAGITLLASMTPEETYTAIVNEAVHLVHAEYGSIILKKGDVLVRIYSSDPFFSRIKLRKGDIIENAFKNNRLMITNTDQPNIHPIIKEMGIKSIILIPLNYHHETIGILSLESLNREHFTQKEVDMLRVFGSMASFAIKKAQSYDETKKALEIRDMFISMAAHELRTPLTSISGYIQLLYSKLAGRDGPEGKWIQALYEENKRMMNLVKELLEVNRLKAGQIQFRWQECNLDSLLKRSIQNVGQRFPGREINYKNQIKTEITIIGDSERLIQVFENVLDNALKYSPKHTEIDIKLLEKQNVYVVMIVDYGKGIDEKDIPNIFNGQHKGTGGEEGMGIGLFFVENVVRQHRGSIVVKSKLKKGTTMEIRLPKAKFEDE